MSYRGKLIRDKVYRSTDGASWIDGGVVGTATGTLQNSAVAIRMAGSTATTSGDGVVVSLAVTPKAAFAGTKQVWSRVADGSGAVATDADANFGFKTEGTLQINLSGAGSQSVAATTPSAPSS